MMKRVVGAIAAALSIATTAAPAAAQEQDTAIANLQRQVEALTREIEAMRLGEDVVVRADSSAFGLGPAASKVYRVRQGVSLGGYGEMLYENFANEREDDSPAPTSVRDKIDALRLILYVGYKFTPKLIFNSEIELEHGSTGQGGEASVEFAYVDYKASDAFGVRGGMLLVPMGLINELHEPPIFLGTTRPLTESVIIPTTWRENGAGVFGELGDLSYRAYVINGFDAARGFTATGLRGGRQKGANALIENPALVGRVDFTPAAVRGLMIGGSAYTGNSAQGATAPDGADIDATTTLIEGHAQYQAHGLDLRGLYARATVDDVAALNVLRELTGAASIGEELTGWYMQAGYDVLRTTGSELQLTPYVRYESVNTQESVPAGYQFSPATERTVTVIGAAFKPIPNVVLKGDYQIHKNEAETGLNQFNIALGYLF